MVRHRPADRARQIGKPCLVVALEAGIQPVAFRGWPAEHRIAVSNVAGPRERRRPGAYAAAARGLEALLRVGFPRGAARSIIPFALCGLACCRITEPSESDAETIYIMR